MITIFSILSLIVLINMLIAILSIIFDEIKSQSSLEQSQTIYSYYSDRKFDKEYSSIIALVAPFNLFTLPLVPFILFFQNPKM